MKLGPALPLLLLLLSACGTPQEQCIAQVSQNLRVVDRLIAEGEATLARGYGLEEVTVWETEFVPCGQQFDKKGRPLPPRMCERQVPDTFKRPISVDLDAEAVKLRQLKAKRVALLDAAEPAIAACREAYPE